MKFYVLAAKYDRHVDITMMSFQIPGDQVKILDYDDEKEVEYERVIDLIDLDDLINWAEQEFMDGEYEIMEAENQVKFKPNDRYMTCEGTCNRSLPKEELDEDNICESCKE
jgi:hypothetical protein